MYNVRSPPLVWSCVRKTSPGGCCSVPGSHKSDIRVTPTMGCDDSQGISDILPPPNTVNRKPDDPFRL